MKVRGDRSAYQKSWRDQRVSAGICLRCGKFPSVPDRRHCSVCLERANEKAKSKSREIKQEVIEGYGGKCVCCGETNPAFLTLDHIFGNGRESRRLFLGYSYSTSGAPFYSALKRAGFPKGELQVLCWNCNVAKFHLGQCPHQSKK